MQNPKNMTLAVIAATATLFFLLIFIAVASSGYLYYTGAALFLLFAAWITIILTCILIALKSLRAFITIFGMMLIGLPFAFLMAYFAYGAASALIFTIFMSTWTLLSGYLIRSAKGMYWSLHLTGWILGIGLSIYSANLYYFNPYYGYVYPIFFFYPIWILLPLGFSTVLGAQYPAVMAFLNRLNFLQPRATPQQESPRAQTVPLPLSETSYQQGYQAGKIYEEGGKVFSYPQEQEQPQAHYPRESNYPSQQSQQ